MTKGPNSTWISIQISPSEVDHLNEVFEARKRENPGLTRNAFLRELIREQKVSA